MFGEHDRIVDGRYVDVIVRDLLTCAEKVKNLKPEEAEAELHTIKYFIDEIALAIDQWEDEKRREALWRKIYGD